jgi:plasmid stabilization system protein ParE
VVNRIKVIWGKRALKDLSDIRSFYVKKSESSAKAVISKIVDTIEKIGFADQYQIDEILGDPYRRMIVGQL